MTEKVEVRVEGLSVEVEPKFYRVALGVLSLGFPALDFYQVPDDDFFCVVFAEAEELEDFMEFLLVHGMFRDPETGSVETRGSFVMDKKEGEPPTPTYFLDVPEIHRVELEACLAAHAPVTPGSSGGLN